MHFKNGTIVPTQWNKEHSFVVKRNHLKHLGTTSNDWEQVPDFSSQSFKEIHSSLIVENNKFTCWS